MRRVHLCALEECLLQFRRLEEAERPAGELDDVVGEEVEPRPLRVGVDEAEIGSGGLAVLDPPGNDFDAIPLQPLLECLLGSRAAATEVAGLVGAELAWKLLVRVQRAPGVA